MPNAEVEVQATTSGIVGSNNVRLSVTVEGAETSPSGRNVGTETFQLLARAEHASRFKLRFSKPGVYRVTAVAIATEIAGARESRDDITINDLSSAYLFLEVRPEGGRALDIWRPRTGGEAVDRPRYGGFGDLVSLALLRAEAKNNPATASSTLFTGTVNYQALYTSGIVTRRVPEAQVNADCLNGAFQSVGLRWTIADSSGHFSIDCPSEAAIADVSVFLTHPRVDVYGAGWSDSTSIQAFILPGASDLFMSNDHAAHVFTQLVTTMADSYSKFARTRPSVAVWVGPALPTDYVPANDLIRYNSNRVFGSQQEANEFVIIHEYGHAFQYKGIEPAGEYNCGGGHAFNAQNSLSCAFVEGFADFYAAWVAGARLVANLYSDYTIDLLPPTSGDGARIENAVAGFLYDLADSGAEPDGPANTPNGDDEGVAYGGVWIANLIKHCSLTGLSALSGVDHLAYCMESSVVGPRNASLAYSSVWRNYGSVTPATAPPPGWNAAAIRTLWLKNLYRVP